MTINKETINITNNAGSFAAYFAAPTANPAPGVIVIQEIFGVNAHIRSIVERYAEAGYAALAPDIFWRIEPGIELGYTSDDVAKGRELKAKMNLDDVIEDVQASFAALSARPECQANRLGIVGYCYGGLVTYAAAARLQPACAASYYGGGINEYLAEADHIDCPIEFHFGAQDASIPVDQVEQLRSATATKTNVQIFVYPDAGHGFHCDQRSSYNQSSSDKAWHRTLSLFEQHLA